MITISPDLTIDENDIEERFILATGPGGQNVNKVATAVQLRFDVSGLPADIGERLARIAGRRLSRAGILVIEARRFRNRERNRVDARQRLIVMLRKAAHVTPARVSTRPTRAIRARRLETKKRRARTKTLRRRPGDPDSA
jgi:ribosome-associated protein